MHAPCPSSTEIPQGFNDDLVRGLALLHDAPPGIAESTITLLRFGARALLEETEPPLIEVSYERPVEITITPHGRRVIEACARYVEEAGPRDWEDRSLGEDSWSRNHEEKLERAIETIERTGLPADAEAHMREHAH